MMFFVLNLAEFNGGREYPQTGDQAIARNSQLESRQRTLTRTEKAATGNGAHRLYIAI